MLTTVVTVILYEDRYVAVATEIGEMLRQAYGEQMEITLLNGDTVESWPTEPSWDDLIIVPFDEVPISDRSVALVGRELSARGSITALPVALTATHPRPPNELAHIKALPFTDSDSRLRLVRRVGALLGLRLRSRDQLIFISYRATDGALLAQQLETFLTSHGYKVWRDESRDEFDHETSILPGTDVQEAIQENLRRADLLLLLDTPHAAESTWIKLEVDQANGDLIPVLPLLLLAPGEHRQTSRFRSLATLQRGCRFIANPARNQDNLTEDELDQVLAELETYLCDIFSRKRRVPFLVEKEFTSHGYTWTPRDRFIYEALRRNSGTLRTRVFSHCSYFEGIYDPALDAFVHYLQSVIPRANFSLYVYDGPLISNVQLEDERFGFQVWRTHHPRRTSDLYARNFEAGGTSSECQRRASSCYVGHVGTLGQKSIAV
jgi:hypothetical protein